MATVRKTIILTEQQDASIAAQIAAGRYTNDSEAIRDLIRRAQERSFEIESVRQALIEGRAANRSGSTLPRSSSAKPRSMAEPVRGRGAISMGCSTVMWPGGVCLRRCAISILSKPPAPIRPKRHSRRRAAPVSDLAIGGAVSRSMSSIFGRRVTASPSSESCISEWMPPAICDGVDRSSRADTKQPERAGLLRAKGRRPAASPMIL